uniref:CsbD family protein n=1 Tax=uncultured Sphingomonas sp. TaxID=158754 RepID=UPI0035C9D0FC
MNSTQLEGAGQDLGGNIKEAAGNITGDQTLEGKGIADQVVGNAKQVAGAAIDAVSNPGPLVDKARSFARQRPYATAALVGVLGLALINTLRGK